MTDDLTNTIDHSYCSAVEHFSHTPFPRTSTPQHTQDISEEEEELSFEEHLEDDYEDFCISDVEEEDVEEDVAE